MTSSAVSQAPVWIGDDRIDPQWLEAVTDLTDLVGCQVQDMSNETRKGHVPKDGATLKLVLTYKDTSSSTQDQPKSVVLKQVAPSSLPQSRQLGLAREAFFYSYVSSQQTNGAEKWNLSIPRIFYAHGDMATGNKWVIMEDLSTKTAVSKESVGKSEEFSSVDSTISGEKSSILIPAYIDSGILFGPGNPNLWNRDLPKLIQEAYPNKDPPTSRQVSMDTFASIAKVHAAFWKDSSLLLSNESTTTGTSLPRDWLRGADWIQGQGKTSWEASQGYLQGIWQDLQKGGKVDQVISWDPLVHSLVETAMKGISWEAQLQRLNMESHWTLVHGDFWPGNVLVQTAQPDSTDAATVMNDSLKLLDWEMVGVGSGPQDLGQYILSNMDPEERRQCEKEVIQHYYQELIRWGVMETDFTWEDCWKEYRVGGLERWLWFLVYFCGQSEALLSWAQFFHDQIKEFVHDHDIQPRDIVQPRP
eukprot:Nitzschia sp. Nitz4//scaffold212_size37733//9361//10779//NITZ4_007731-RA/size37733-processed-gene-0.43-mRNA-1//-1//CDS//3329542016//5102//frame0